MDLLRIIAILCVIYNHTNEHGYFLYAFPSGMILKVFYIAVAAIIAIGVPIFFMISGALLLGKEESIEYVYSHRVLRMSLVLFIITILQYVFLLSTNQAELSVRWLADHTVSDNIVPSYWYLYTYISYLIFLPLLRKLAQAMSNKEYIYLIGLYLVIEAGVRTAMYFGGYTEFSVFFKIPFFENIVILPLVGYYMENRMTKEDYNSKGALKLICASGLSLVVFVAMTLYRNLPYEEFTSYDKGLYTCGLTLIMDITVFYIIKYLVEVKRQEKPHNETVRKILGLLGTSIFGIYLVEGNIRYYTEFIDIKLATYVGQFPAAVIWVFLIFVIGLAVSFFLRHIPGLRKLL